MTSHCDNVAILDADAVSMRYGRLVACDRVCLSVFKGELLGIVGESGSGKSTLLKCLSGRLEPTSGRVHVDTDGRGKFDLYSLPEQDRRALRREHFGFVHQTPRDGLRMHASAGANVIEQLLNQGERSYARLLAVASDWFDRVEIDRARLVDPPRFFSGGMQQRVQIARSLVHAPRLVFMDEPTGGLDVSVQARLLDLLRQLVRDLRLSVVIVTHDLSVARLLADRLLVMKSGRVVEQGLTDQILDDPKAPYTQLLVSAAL